VGEFGGGGGSLHCVYACGIHTVYENLDGSCLCSAFAVFWDVCVLLGSAFAVFWDICVLLRSAGGCVQVLLRSAFCCVLRSACVQVLLRSAFCAFWTPAFPVFWVLLCSCSAVFWNPVFCCVRVLLGSHNVP